MKSSNKARRRFWEYQCGSEAIALGDSAKFLLDADVFIKIARAQRKATTDNVMSEWLAVRLFDAAIKRFF